MGEQHDFVLAVEELTRIQHRIRELESLLTDEPTDDLLYSPGLVTIGSRVTVEDTHGRLQTLILVSPLESGGVRGHVSASPVGAALLGRRTGDTVQVSVPAGVRTLAVVSVE
jgi:transcription elongation factor GreA